MPQSSAPKKQLHHPAKLKFPREVIKTKASRDLLAVDAALQKAENDITDSVSHSILFIDSSIEQSLTDEPSIQRPSSADSAQSVHSDADLDNIADVYCGRRLVEATSIVMAPQSAVIAKAGLSLQATVTADELFHPPVDPVLPIDNIEPPTVTEETVSLDSARSDVFHSPAEPVNVLEGAYMWQIQRPVVASQDIQASFSKKDREKALKWIQLDAVQLSAEVGDLDGEQRYHGRFSRAVNVSKADIHVDEVRSERWRCCRLYFRRWSRVIRETITENRLHIISRPLRYWRKAAAQSANAVRKGIFLKRVFDTV